MSDPIDCYYSSDSSDLIQETLTDITVQIGYTQAGEVAVRVKTPRALSSLEIAIILLRFLAPMGEESAEVLEYLRRMLEQEPGPAPGDGRHQGGH